MPNPSQVIGRVEEELSAAIGTDQRDMSTDYSPNVFSWLVEAGEILPPWWSTARDRILFDMWKRSNHLAIAFYNAQAKIVGIPPRIVARDSTNTAHVEQAEMATELMLYTSGFGQGWDSEYAKYVESLLVQDNGAFMEVIGLGPSDGPIIGMPLGVRHLDSQRCQRTGNPEYPVVYMDDDGARWKIYWTRLIYSSQMPSARKEMHNVGFCALSRVLDIGSTLGDMVRYKQERLGSRPQNQLLVGKNISAKQIMLALRMHEENLNNMGFTNYARTAVIGSENNEIGIDKIDLNHMEPFDEETFTNLGMFAIAAGLGMDADELWPVAGKSAGKQEANIRRMRSRGRLPAQITSDIARQFNFKVMPPHLMMEFDFRDDEEDMQRANIRDIRARNRERDIGTGSINVRAARTRMLNDGDVDRPTFEQMELSDGRLPDGRAISVLFYSDLPVHQRLLTGFMDDPLAIAANIYEIGQLGENVVNDEKLNDVLIAIQGRRAETLREWARTNSGRKAAQVGEAYYALDWLEEQYLFAAGRILPEVPMHQRRSRTDIRVQPQQESPDSEVVSPAGAEMPIDENIERVGG